MTKHIYHIMGHVVVQQTGLGIAGLRVEAWDKDLLFDDLLGSAGTDDNGAFIIEFDVRYYDEIMDRQPDIYFKVFRDKQLVKDTLENILWNVREPEVHVVIPISRDELPAANGFQLYRVEGRVTTEEARAVRDVIVELWDQQLGSEKLLTSGVTDKAGNYVLYYDPALLDTKTRADIMIRVLDPRQQRLEIARSKVIYQAEPVTVVNLTVVAAQVSRPTEYQRLLSATKPLLKQTMLKDLDANGVTFVASRSGWDARMVAMAAESARLQSETQIPANHYYALLRAGIQVNTIHQLTDASVRRALETAIANGVIADDNPIDTTLEIYRNLRVAALQEFTPVAAVSKLGDMLDLRLDTARKQQFLEAYQSTAGQPEMLWSTLAEAGFDEASIARLKTDGKLGFLTRQNAPLIARLGENAGINQVEDLPRAGLYKAEAWTALIGDDVPPNLSAEQYAAGLAIQVSRAYPNLVTAEMVRRGEIAVETPAAEEEGEVAAFLRSSHGKHTLGREPINQWDGYQQLTANGKETASLVERLYQLSPSNESMVSLSNLGFRSAYQITREPQTLFMQKYSDSFPTPYEAQLVYKKAMEVHTTVLNLAMMYITYGVAPNVYALTGSATKKELDIDAPGSPTLEDLLGNMDYCACEHCKSVLSPAAYFVDLLNFIDVADVPATKRNPIDVLFERRPDLQHLLLSCENTNIALPYIDIVNEILEYYVVNGSLVDFPGYNMGEDSKTADVLADPQYVEATAYNTTKGQVYPSTLPFDMPLAALRLLMQAWDTTLPAALRLFTTPAAARRETLALNSEEYSVLTDVAFRQLPEYFGEPAGTSIEDLNNAVADGKTFSRRTEISYQDLVDILKTRFINPGVVLLPLLEALRVSLQQLQSWYDGAMSDVELLALFPDDIDPADYFGGILQWLQDNEALIMGLITLTDVSSEPVECDFATLELRFALPNEQENRLTPLAYHKLVRFIRLWKKLGWSIDLTDRVVMTFLGMPSQDLTMGNIDETFVALLARIANLLWFMERLLVKVKKYADWLPVWEGLSESPEICQETLAHLLRIGTTDLAHFIEITGIDPLADDLDADTPSAHRFLDAWETLKTAKLKVSDFDYVLRHLDETGKLAPTEDTLLHDLKALRDSLTAVDAELNVAPESADMVFARQKMALVYDAAIIDWFINLVSDNTTYEAPFVTVEEVLPAKLTATDTRLGFDSFRKVLTYRGVLSDAARKALGNVADTLVLADMDVITTQPELDAYVAAFKVSAQSLTDAGAAHVQELADEYPELQAVYDDVIVAPDPATQTQVLVAQIVATLRSGLKTTSLRTVLASQLKLSRQLIDVLTEGPQILHTNSDNTQGILEDFLALEGAITFAANQEYAIYLDPPATDDYILYVSAPAGTNVTLTLGDTTVIPSTVVGPTEEISTSGPISLKAGVLITGSLTLALLPGGETARLSWRTKAMAKHPVPDARLYSDTLLSEARASLIRLQKAAMLLRAMPLTARELRHLAAVDVDTVGYLNDLDVDGSIAAGTLHDQWARMAWIGWFSKLKSEEPEENVWVSLLEDPTQTSAQGTLLLAGANMWQKQDLLDTLTHFGLAITDVASLHVLRKIKKAVGFIAEVSQPAADFLAWAIDAPDAALISDIKQTLRERLDDLSWRTTMQSVNDALRNQRRDALVSYILHHAPPTPSIDTADKLYEYFLIDVEMDACMKTSRIRQGLSTIQLFITRCLLNLESEVEPSSIRADHWAWMKRYRVWEANRKIFLWPENWLEPELRDNKSPFYRELESDLLKADITDELAENAYLAYLKKLDEVARLEIVGSYLQEQQHANPDDDILHVFGRTNGNAKQYYYRRYEYGEWTPWEKVGLNIQSDLLLPVIWKHQLFLFWVTTAVKAEVDKGIKPADMGDVAWGINATITAEIYLNWGEYYDGKWTSPKSSELNDPMLIKGLSTFDPKAMVFSARTEKPSPDVAERLIMSLLYLGPPTTSSYLGSKFKWFNLVFTSKNAPPIVSEGADPKLFTNSELFNYSLLWSPEHAALLDSNTLREPGKIFKVRIGQPKGAIAGYLDETILTKTGKLYNGFRVRPVMHPIENQWEAPLFYSDEHSVFFISADERVESFPLFKGYFWNDDSAVVVSDDKINIPPLYEEPVVIDPWGPIINPLVKFVNPYYEQTIGNNNAFVYRGTAFDAQGVVTEETVR